MDPSIPTRRPNQGLPEGPTRREAQTTRVCGPVQDKTDGAGGDLDRSRPTQGQVRWPARAPGLWTWLPSRLPGLQGAQLRPGSAQPRGQLGMTVATGPTEGRCSALEGQGGGGVSARASQQSGFLGCSQRCCVRAAAAQRCAWGRRAQRCPPCPGTDPGPGRALLVPVCPLFHPLHASAPPQPSELLLSRPGSEVELRGRGRGRPGCSWAGSGRSRSA